MTFIPDTIFYSNLLVRELDNSIFHKMETLTSQMTRTAAPLRQWSVKVSWVTPLTKQAKSPTKALTTNNLFVRKNTEYHNVTTKSTTIS